MRITTAALAVFMSSTMLAGAASAETVRWASSFDALTIDPHSQNSGRTHNFNRHMYDPLVGRDLEGNLVGRLATDWYLKDGDDTVWVFELREGVTFHDGADFTAEDVVFSIMRAKSDNSNLRQLHADVVSITAVDDYTVEVQMTGPSPLYPNNVTNTFIMDKDWSEANNVVDVQNYAAGEENFAVRNANGTGPYRLVERDPDVRSTLQAFEDHWGGSFPITEIIWLPISDAATRIAALLSGEIDFVQDVPFQDIERLSADPDITLVTGPENRVSYFGYKVSEEPLSSSNITDVNPLADARVREAMHLVIDREAIRQIVMRGQGTPTCMLAPLRVNGWREEYHECAPVDVERANALMEEAGYGDGFTITLDTSNTAANHEAVSQAVVGMLGQIGIDVALASRPQAQHSPQVTAGGTDFYMLSWGVPTFDSAYIFNDLVHSRSGNYGTYNPSGYVDAEVDAMIESLGVETNIETRDATIAAIWDEVQAFRLYIPIQNDPLAYAMREGFNIAVHLENQPSMTTMTLE